MKGLVAVLTLTVAASIVAAGSVPQSAGDVPHDPKASPAYAVLVLRRAAAEAELADLSPQFTGGSRDARAKRFELNVISREMEGMHKVGRDYVSKLSKAYGGLILSKVVLEVELDGLLNNFTPRHPDVKKKRAELAALEREIENILK